MCVRSLSDQLWKIKNTIKTTLKTMINCLARNKNCYIYMIRLHVPISITKATR